MPLPLNTNTGSFTPYIKYNAKAGRWFARFKAQGGGWTEDIEVERPRLVFDFDHIRTGWILFPPSGAPQTVFDPPEALADPTAQAQRPPGDNWKRGFRVLVAGNDPIQSANGQTLGVRELMSNANALIGPILEMYNAWEQEVQQNPGKVPFYACNGIKAVGGGQGATNYQPVFELLGWVSRDKVPGLEEAVQSELETNKGNAPVATQNQAGVPFEASAAGWEQASPSMSPGGDATEEAIIEDDIPF